jgi:hypothetical protein
MRRSPWGAALSQTAIRHKDAVVAKRAISSLLDSHLEQSGNPCFEYINTAYSSGNDRNRAWLRRAKRDSGSISSL